MVENKPLISIIIPVFRIEAYVGECIESVLTQTYKNLQIIVVDDGSDDKCPPICDEFAQKDKRVTVIHKKNGGLSSARNAGLDIAKGDFVYFVDGDDLINARCIERLLSIMIEQDCDIVQCKTYAFLDIKELPPKESIYCAVEDYSGHDYCRLLLNGKLGTDGGVVWDKLYKRSFFDSLRFPKGMIYEDDATVFRLYWEAEKVVRTNEQLAYYRSRRAGSIMHVGKMNYKDMISVRKIQYDFFLENKESDLAMQVLYLMANDYAFVRADKNQSLICREELRGNHKEILGKVCTSNLSIVKKTMNYLGYISPSLWNGLKSTKAMVKRISNSIKKGRKNRSER